MARQVTRRQFMLTATAGGIGIATGKINRLVAAAAAPFLNGQHEDLYSLSHSLSATWASTLLGLQVKDAAQVADYGGICCPSYHTIHGRIGDTIYPFMHMARRTGDSRYLDASVLLFRWMEANVSQPDGSWLNEKNVKWKGTTVFTVIALCEALRFHGELMDPSFKNALHDRLVKAGEFIDANINIDYGNINYPNLPPMPYRCWVLYRRTRSLRRKVSCLRSRQKSSLQIKIALFLGKARPIINPVKKDVFPSISVTM